MVKVISRPTLNVGTFYQQAGDGSSTERHACRPIFSPLLVFISWKCNKITLGQTCMLLKCSIATMGATDFSDTTHISHITNTQF